MRALGQFILVALIASGVHAFMKGGSSNGLPDNAPPGAIEYFESQDGEHSIALFPKSLEINLAEEDGGHFSLPISAITSFRKYGSKVLVNSTEGQLEFSVTGFRGGADARHFTDSLQELIDQN